MPLPIEETLTCYKMLLCHLIELLLMNWVVKQIKQKPPIPLKIGADKLLLVLVLKKNAKGAQ